MNTQAFGNWSKRLKLRCRALHLCRSLLTTVALLGLAFALTSPAGAQSATLPPPIVASSTTVVATGLSQPHAVGRNSAGDLFVANSGTSQLIEVPQTGGAQVVLATVGSYPEGVAVDPSGNIFTTDFSGELWKVPAGGGAASGVKFTSGSPCPDFAAAGYYLGFDDVSTDGAGNVYASTNNVAYLYKFDPTGTMCTELLTPATIGGAGVRIGNIAADSAGDVYFSEGTSLFVLKAGATTPTPIAGTFAAIAGLRVDPQGNLFITDAMTIDEIPIVGGALAPAKLAYITAFGPAAAIAIDANGYLYSAAFNAGTISRTTIGSLALGSSAAGTQGTSGALTYVFNAAEAPTSFSYATASAASAEFITVPPAVVPSPNTTCAADTAYAASTSAAPSFCTLNVAPTPAGVGKRTAVVDLVTSAGVLTRTNLSGTGTGAGVSVDPGTQTTLAGTYTTPSAIKVDGAGNIFIADSALNTVTELPAGGGTPVIVGSGLSRPAALALDPAGDLFMADTGNNRIVEVPYTATGLNTAGQLVIATGLSAPIGLATDLQGNLLVAQTGSALLKIPGQGGIFGAAPPFAVGSGFTKPSAVAVDSAGNYYVADQTLATISEITPNGTQTSLVSGFAGITGLAIDAAGDLFLTQSSSSSITRIPFSAGAYNANATTSIGTGLRGPQGLGIDGPGNLYVADAAGSAAYSIQRTLGSLAFGSVNLGSTSVPQTLSLSNSGAATLTFSTPFFRGTGNTGEFNVAASSSNGCAATLAGGASCNVTASFAPTATGTRAEQILFQSNAASAAQLGANLSGTGVNLAPTTLTLAQTSPAAGSTISFGQTVTVSATVAATTGTATPGGTVQFFVNGVASGTPVTLAAGVASQNFTRLSPGVDVINASYSGAAAFASSSASNPIMLTIALASTTTTLTASINSSTAVATGSSAIFTAAVIGSTTLANPTGTVTFTASAASGAVVLGTVALGTTGQASLTTTALPNGTYNVVAQYSGDTTFTGSTSAGFTVYVHAPSYIITNPLTGISAPVVGSGSGTFTVAPIAGYIGAVDLACTGLPAHATCNFSPVSVDFTTSAAPQVVTLTVRTSVQPPASNVSLLFFPGLIGLAGAGVFRKRKELRNGLLAIVALTLLAGGALTGCGTSMDYTPAATSAVTVVLTGTPNIPPGTTPPGTGTNNIVQSFTFSLQVH